MSAPPDPDLFPPALVDAVNELNRELLMRDKLYPQWVATGRLKGRDAAWRQACLRLARDRLRAIYSEDR